MKCKKCGNELLNNSNTCEVCGKINLLDGLNNNGVNNNEVNNNEVNNQGENNNTIKKKSKEKIIVLCAFIAIIVIILSLLLLPLVNKKNTDLTLLNVKNSMSKLNNLNMELSMDISAKDAENSYSISMISSMDIDIKNNINKTTYSISMLGMDIDSTSYTEKSNDKYITYTKDLMDDTWTKSTSDDSKIGYENFALLLSGNFNIQKIDSDKKELSKFKITLSYEDLKNTIYNISSTDNSLVNLDDYDYNKNIILYVYINSKNYISKIVMDMVENIKFDKTDESSSIEKFLIEINFSKYNEIGNIIIPEDIKNSAEEGNNSYIDDDTVDYTDFTSEDYMDEIVYSAESYCFFSSDFGGEEIDFSNYQNQLELGFDTPKTGKLYIDGDCNVTIRDNILIDGKSCTYSDSISTCN